MIRGRAARLAVRAALVASVLLLVGGAGLALMVQRLAEEGTRAMVESDALFDQGKVYESLVHARRAASLYAPGLSHVRRADARLDAIAAGAEANRMTRVAMLAWQAIRTTELLRMEGWGRSEPRLMLANRRIWGLESAGGDGTGLSNEARRRRRASDELGTRVGARFAVVVGQLGSLGVIVAGILAMSRAVRRRPGGGARELVVSFAVVMVGAVSWAVCLLLV